MKIQKIYLRQWSQVLRSDVSVSAEAAGHDHRGRVLCQHCHISSGHHTCLTCLACTVSQGSEDHCWQVLRMRTGSLLTGVSCTAVHSLTALYTATLWAASVHMEHTTSQSVRRPSLILQVFSAKILPSSERNQGDKLNELFLFKYNDLID